MAACKPSPSIPDGLLIFIIRISNMQDCNWPYAAKLTILALSPPPSQRMDSARRVDSGGLFFGIFPKAQRKNPRSIPMRVSLSSLVPGQGLDFVRRSCVQTAVLSTCALTSVWLRNRCWVICSALTALFTQGEGNSLPIDQITARAYSV